MTTLMITPFAPARDGIANYAVQEVAAMRRGGEDVEVLSPLPSAAHHHLVVGSITGMARLARMAGRYERIIVQAFPELLFGACRHRLERVAVWLAWERLARRVPVEFRLHEVDPHTIDADRFTNGAATRALAALSVRAVHTASEREALHDLVPGVGEVVLVDHGASFRARTTLDRARARASLGLDPDVHLFVSIGFVQRHKGFDRAVRAFARLETDRAQLHVVGDIRVDHPDLAAYRDELRRLIDATPGCFRRAGYVGDAEFDRWLVAADCVVLPYRSIWSSGVVERAALFDTPVIVTDVGGLADQARPGTVVVADDRALEEAMAASAGVTSRSAEFDELAPDREQLESLMRRRAGTVQADGRRRPTDRIARIPYVALGSTDSERPLVPQVKRLIQRVTAWQLEPVRETVNELRDATIAALDESWPDDE